jgi:hypothetical protein
VPLFKSIDMIEAWFIALFITVDLQPALLITRRIVFLKGATISNPLLKSAGNQGKYHLTLNTKK